MSNISKTINPVYSAEIEDSIVIALNVELATKNIKNGNVLNGIGRKFRNRFSEEAGLDYSEAHAKFYETLRAFQRANERE
jgi:hypothetical protein